MKRTRLLLFLSLFALLVPLGTASRTKAQTPITVKLWMSDFKPRVTIDNELIPKFEAANPNIKVDYQAFLGSDYDAKLATAFGAGAGPDMFNQWTDFIANSYAQGLLAPVDAKSAGFDSIQAVYDSYSNGKTILSGAEFNGVLYGLPTEISNFFCFANDDLFKAAGLDASKDFPKTWEDMITVAQKLTKRDSAGVLKKRSIDFNCEA